MQPSAVCVALAWLPLSAHAGLTLHLQGNWVPGMPRAIDPPALAGAEALPAGSAEEAQARAALQRELDSGAATLRVYVVE